MNAPFQRRLSVHGLSVGLELSSPFLQPTADSVLRPFITDGPASSIPLTRGTIKAFDSSEVLRSVSPSGKPAGWIDSLAQLYVLGEQFWLVDERWGICWMNLLKRQWRSWLLPRPTLSTAQCVDAAVLWPMAQLLKTRGLQLIPATTIWRDGWGALLLSPYAIDREIDCLVRNGFTLIGRRWSVLRDPRENVQLLPFPDEAVNRPALELTASVDCHAVFMVESGRRQLTRGRALRDPDDAADRLRHAWPMADLPRARRRVGDIAAKLARSCRCVTVELSRNEQDFFQLIESSRRRWGDSRKIRVTFGAALHRDQFLARRCGASAPA